MINNLIKFIVLGVIILAFSGCDVWDYGEHPQVTAIKKIADYADSTDGNNSKNGPDAKLYKSAGINIDGSDINTTNAYIKTLSSEDVDTKEEIQEIVDNIDELTAPPNKKPVAKINVHATEVTSGEAVLLDAIESTDSDGDIVKYEWKEDGKVLGTGISYDAILPVRRHIITLVVTDDDGDTGTDHISVIVSEKQNETRGGSNIKPTANIEVNENNGSIILDASASRANGDGEIDEYLWEEGTKKLSKSRIYDTKDLEAGDHSITLTVTDDKGKEGTTTKKITIKSKEDNTTQDNNAS